MDSNLRIVKSIKKLNDNFINAENEQKKIIQKQNDLENIQNDFEKEIKNIIDKQEEEFKEQNTSLENKLNDKIKNISLTPGPKGDQGERGLPGKNGKDGKDGKNGKDGEDGLNGRDGRDGKDGKDGQDGIDGIGIANAEVNKDGRLIITLTNGKKIDCGVVKGANGIGFAGISVTDVKIEDGHLICILSNGKKIDAGYIGGGGLEISNYGNADFTYQTEYDTDGTTVLNQCVAYSTATGNVNEPKVVKYGRTVNMVGAFKNVNVRPSTAEFVMGKVPSGCEPLYEQKIMQQGSGQYKYLLTIKTDGTMTCSRYSATSTNTAVTNNAWLNINATYISKN